MLDFDIAQTQPLKFEFLVDESCRGPSVVFVLSWFSLNYLLLIVVCFISFYKLLRSVGDVASLIVLAAGRAGGVSTPFKNPLSTPDCALAAGNRPHPYELWMMT